MHDDAPPEHVHDAQVVDITPAHGHGRLRPFTPASASAAGKRSADTRRATRALKAHDARALREALDTCMNTFTRADLGPACAAVAGQILARIAAGTINVRGDDAAALLRVLVDIARVEAGEATHASVVAHVSTRDALAHVELLRARAREVLASGAGEAIASAAATAADDSQVGELPTAEVDPRA